MQARKRSALSRSSGRGVWGRFFELDDPLWLITKRLCEVEIELATVKDVVTVDEDGTAERLEAAKEDYYELANILYRSATEYHLNVKPPPSPPPPPLLLLLLPPDVKLISALSVFQF
ncbi:hypothetical protein ZWY2020_053141 [Hordeum vulgare]|nr:hypothetical protein ZWY2020_053141 [Hordeum vulgare]